jgi:hypothetical protein
MPTSITNMMMLSTMYPSGVMRMDLLLIVFPQMLETACHLHVYYAAECL